MAAVEQSLQKSRVRFPCVSRHRDSVPGWGKFFLIFRNMLCYKYVKSRNKFWSRKFERKSRRIHMKLWFDKDLWTNLHVTVYPTPAYRKEWDGMRTIENTAPNKSLVDNVTSFDYRNRLRLLTIRSKIFVDVFSRNAKDCKLVYV